MIEFKSWIYRDQCKCFHSATNSVDFSALNKQRSPKQTICWRVFMGQMLQQ